jgi:hypothetical protein
VGDAEYGSLRTLYRIRSCSIWILLSVLLASALWAQKAKPLRIALKDGAAIVEGRLRDRQQTDYEAEAGPSMTLTLQLWAAPAKTLALTLYTPEGAEMPLHAEGPNRWTAKLSHGGDYGISVLRTSHKPGTSIYRLTVTIR